MISVVERVFREVSAVGGEALFDEVGGLVESGGNFAVPISRLERDDFDCVYRRLDSLALGLLAGAGSIYKDTEGGDGILTEDFVGNLARVAGLNLLYILSEDVPVQSSLTMNARLHVVDRQIYRNAAEVLAGRLPEELRACNSVIGVQIPSPYFVWPVRRWGDSFVECGLGVLRPDHVVIGVF